MLKAVLRLGTCGTHMGILPESTDSLKTSYFSRESTFRVASDFFVAVGVRYALKFKLNLRRALLPYKNVANG